MPPLGVSVDLPPLHLVDESTGTIETTPVLDDTADSR